MPTHDPIADYLTRIRNAISAYHKEVNVLSSRVKLEITQILENEGFIDSFKFNEDEIHGSINIKLKYDSEGKSPITCLKRVSKPSLRIYKSKRDLPKVLSGLGIAIISTSKGILTDRDCRKFGIGGEVLCYIW